MGVFAEARLNGDLTDGDEHFRVASESGGLRVTWVDSNPGGAGCEFARAGVAGGIDASIDFDLFDPKQSGKEYS